MRLTRTTRSARFTKYAVGSVIAFISSNIAFALFYILAATTTVCAVAGFIVGAIRDVVLNRRWGWQCTGRA